MPVFSKASWSLYGCCCNQVWIQGGTGQVVMVANTRGSGKKPKEVHWPRDTDVQTRGQAYVLKRDTWTLHSPTAWPGCKWYPGLRELSNWSWNFSKIWWTLCSLDCRGENLVPSPPGCGIQAGTGLKVSGQLGVSQRSNFSLDAEVWQRWLGISVRLIGDYKDEWVSYTDTIENSREIKVFCCTWDVQNAVRTLDVKHVASCKEVFTPEFFSLALVDANICFLWADVACDGSWSFHGASWGLW